MQDLGMSQYNKLEKTVCLSTQKASKSSVECKDILSFKWTNEWSR